MSENRTPLLHVENLKQYFRISRRFTTKAVDGISFDIYEGETYGLVGESGSGKSTTGRSIIRLYEPTDGKIIFDGRDISGKLSKEDEKYLRTNMQMIFQDPMACLNPARRYRRSLPKGSRSIISAVPRKRSMKESAMCWRRWGSQANRRPDSRISSPEVRDSVSGSRELWS